MSGSANYTRILKAVYSRQPKLQQLLSSEYDSKYIFSKITSPTEIHAPKVVCESENCGEKYASNGGMKNHYNKSHKTVEIQSPLGKFPAADPARTFFDEEDEPSTQGNSAGQFNSPKVSSAGQYICGLCDNNFDSKSKVDDHKSKEHEHQPVTAPTPPLTVDELDVENEVLEAAKDEQDLYDEIFRLSQSAAIPGQEEESFQVIKDKFERFKIIMTKKDI